MKFKNFPILIEKNSVKNLIRILHKDDVKKVLNQPKTVLINFFKDKFSSFEELNTYLKNGDKIVYNILEYMTFREFEPFYQFQEKFPEDIISANSNNIFSLISVNPKYSFLEVSGNYIYLNQYIKILLKNVLEKPKNLFLEKSQKTDDFFSNENHIFQIVDSIKSIYKNDSIKKNKNFSIPKKELIKIYNSNLWNKIFDDEKIDFYLFESFTNFVRKYLISNNLSNLSVYSLLRFLFNDFDAFHSFFNLANLGNHSAYSFTPYYSDFCNNTKEIILELDVNESASINNFIYILQTRNTKNTFEYAHQKLFSIFQKIFANESEYIHYTHKVFTSTLLGFLAILGCVEIKFQPPENNSELLENRTYLHPLENISDIALTQTGINFFKGNVEYVPFSSNKPEKSIVFNPDTLTIFAQNIPIDDELFLSNISVKSIKNQYQVSKESFLRNCNKLKDIYNIKKKLNELSNNKLPENWISFIKTLEENSSKISTEKNWKIFHIENDSKLINIIFTDVQLKRIIIKAENFKILIEEKNGKMFKQIMKSHGYIF